jgi:hypothetical protein
MRISFGERWFSTLILYAKRWRGRKGGDDRINLYSARIMLYVMDKVIGGIKIRGGSEERRRRIEGGGLREILSYMCDPLIWVKEYCICAMSQSPQYFIGVIPFWPFLLSASSLPSLSFISPPFHTQHDFISPSFAPLLSSSLHPPFSFIPSSPPPLLSSSSSAPSPTASDRAQKMKGCG